MFWVRLHTGCTFSNHRERSPASQHGATGHASLSRNFYTSFPTPPVLFGAAQKSHLSVWQQPWWPVVTVLDTVQEHSLMNHQVQGQPFPRNNKATELWTMITHPPLLYLLHSTCTVEESLKPLNFIASTDCYCMFVVHLP